MKEKPPASILYLEDHADTRTVVAKLLSMDGYDVTTAETAAQARELLSSRSFDLFIADIGLPDQDGISLMREVRQLFTCPAIAVSAHAERNYLDAALAAGFKRFLTKPLSIETVKETVSELLAAERASK